MNEGLKLEQLIGTLKQAKRLLGEVGALAVRMDKWDKTRVQFGEDEMPLKEKATRKDFSAELDELTVTIDGVELICLVDKEEVEIEERQI